MSSTIDEYTTLVSSVMFCIMIINFIADPSHTWDSLHLIVSSSVFQSEKQSTLIISLIFLSCRYGTNRTQWSIRGCL